jgi:hypothetical protein
MKFHGFVNVPLHIDRWSMSDIAMLRQFSIKERAFHTSNILHRVLFLICRCKILHDEVDLPAELLGTEERKVLWLQGAQYL